MSVPVPFASFDVTSAIAAAGCVRSEPRCAHGIASRTHRPAPPPRSDAVSGDFIVAGASCNIPYEFHEAPSSGAARTGDAGDAPPDLTDLPVDFAAAPTEIVHERRVVFAEESSGGGEFDASTAIHLVGGSTIPRFLGDVAPPHADAAAAPSTSS